MVGDLEQTIVDELGDGDRHHPVSAGTGSAGAGFTDVVGEGELAPVADRFASRRRRDAGSERGASAARRSGPRTASLFD